MQVEVFIQFFVGMYDNKQEYIDDWRLVASAYLMSPFGFWFDCVTSVPWSFMDLRFLLVHKRLFYLDLLYNNNSIRFYLWLLKESLPVEIFSGCYFTY